MGRLCWMLAYNGVVAVANLRGGERRTQGRTAAGAASRAALGCPVQHTLHPLRALPVCSCLPGGEYGIEWRDAGSVHNKQVGCTLLCFFMNTLIRMPLSETAAMPTTVSPHPTLVATECV